MAGQGMTSGVGAMLLALSLLWGGSFLFVGIAVAELPPFTIVALRVGLAALALWAVLALTGARVPRSARIWAAFLAMGCLNNAIPFSLIVWGQTQIASGLAAILNATTPIFTVLLAHWLTADERLTGAKLAGVGLGLAGVAVMVGLDALEGLGAAVPAQLAVLAAALSYAAAGIFGRRFRAMGVSPLTTAAGQVTGSALLILPLALWLERPWALAAPSAGTWAAVAALALLSTALAYLLYFRILAAAGATVLLLVTFLIPPSAIAMGWLVLDERLEPRHAAGLALILAGLAAIDGRAARLIRRGKRPPPPSPRPARRPPAP
ncbi:DMT family transporter [Paralimibaculum aggregatum]|uniref:DMT family transporter n=1 Tax=Paralimibaculum aggregatum TaxID=3036245 RepID=A0ABQ6LG73_9RHOB|nr:DMT family transporter [Limibaculum sp. NKW23]GMG81416.1 DMT family transporter [Limibaculum sp. NKW23]